MAKKRFHNPQWYKEAIIYQLHVRSFYDSNKDGVGDFSGLDEKLPYLKDLGINTIWLLPFYPSPLKDDGYDISNYYDVNPIYGNLDDFKKFLKHAHKLDLRVITELVINHTSDQHPWFQRARKAAPGSPERDFYVWSDNNDKYTDARIIFQDFETSNWTWDPVARAYYWHRFYSHQPDLNFDNPKVQESVLDFLDFWFNIGVDGMRLDAVPYLFEREGTNCENLPETHLFLKKLRKHVDKHHRDKMLLAEANQWAEDAVTYFGNGDECHMCFHFPLMPRMFMALEKEDRFPIVDIMGQTPSIPQNTQWAIFLRNHDELTLEMVTDEERDFMYRVYAPESRAKINLGIRRRISPLLGNNRRKIELLNGLLLSLPGSPIIYYGDEIGMGDNIFLGDRNGVRTPMQWNSGTNAGFSEALPQQLYLPVITDHEHHYEAVNVEIQQKNPNSLLWWMKTAINIRKSSEAMTKGDIKILHTPNRKVLVFLRTFGNQTCLVIVNLSRYAQYVEISLPEFKGFTPVEMSGQNPFPVIGDRPLPLSLGGYQFYWLEIEPPKLETLASKDSKKWISLTYSDSLSILSDRDFLDLLEDKFSDFISRASWFFGDVMDIQSLKISSFLPFINGRKDITMFLISVNYRQSPPETYAVPVAYFTGAVAGTISSDFPRQTIAVINNDKGEQTGILAEAMVDQGIRQLMLKQLFDAKKLWRNSPFILETSLPQKLSDAKHSGALAANDNSLFIQNRNTVLVYEGRLVLKFLHRVENGINPEAEIGQFLAGQGKDLPVTPYIGTIKIQSHNCSFSAMLIFGYVPNKRNMYDYMLDHLVSFFEKMKVLEPPDKSDEQSGIEEAIAPFTSAMELMGTRMREIHNTLGAATGVQGFSTERTSELYVRSLYQSVRENIVKSFMDLSTVIATLSPEISAKAEKLFGMQKNVLSILHDICSKKMDSLKIRDHGDLTLDQILFTGRDFVFTDFAGKDESPISARRIKRTVFADLATLIYSLNKTACMALGSKNIRSEDRESLLQWKERWISDCTVSLLKAYYAGENQGIRLFPSDPKTRWSFLKMFLMDKYFEWLSASTKSGQTDKLSQPLDTILRLLEKDNYEM